MNVNSKYIKDENGEVIAPITSTESIYYPTGMNLDSNLDDINNWMYIMRSSLFRPECMKFYTGKIESNTGAFQTTVGGMGLFCVRCYAPEIEQGSLFAYFIRNKHCYYYNEILKVDYGNKGSCEFAFVLGNEGDDNAYFRIKNVCSSEIIYQVYQLNLCP